VALCKGFLEAISWPTLLTLYGGPAAGKTNLALEFVKRYCISSCLYAGISSAPIVERMQALGIDLDSVDIREISDYMDLVSLVVAYDFQKLDLAIIDPINRFAREGGVAFNATLFAIASLYSINERLGIPLVLIAEIHTRDMERPVAENAIYFWSRSVARLERVKDSDLRRIIVEKPHRYEAIFRITGRGIEWLTC